jgi:tetratricopeptide (TPR) repeat protein
MTRILIVLLTLNLLVTSSFAQRVIINENCREAYSEILSLKFDAALKRIQVEKVSNPDNLFIPYLENYIDFLKVTVSEDESLFDSVEKKISIRTNELKQLNDTSKFKNYLLGNISLQWAIVNIKFGNYVTGAIKINRSYRLLKENNNTFPNFIPNKITLGILHIMIGIVPDSYNWLLDLVSMKGNISQGQNELKDAYEFCQNNPEYSYLKDEILYYLGTVNLNLNPDPEVAKFLISKIRNSNNQNLTLTYLAINTMMKNGDNDKALELFAAIDTTINYYPFYYLDFLHGECYLRTLNSNIAKKEFHHFLSNFKGQNYIKDAWQKIAWADLIENDTLGYKKNIQQVLRHGGTFIDADKHAEKLAKSEDIPNIELLKARLLFDGGYYKEAEEILFSIIDSEIPLAERVEKNYRLGRIGHTTNNYKKAKKYYKITIETGSDLTLYFAANAALKLGNIYELEKNNALASHYYNLCLDLDFDEYRNSIRVRAKQGLKRVSGN